MQLSELFNSLKGARLTRDATITSLEFDSRNVTPGALFFAVKGDRFDGHDFIPEAIARGARAIVAERSVDIDVPYAVVKDARSAMGTLAKRFYGTFDDITTIGITGTNGKTTTALLTHSILSIAGLKPGLLGTIWYIVDSVRSRAVRTTPESLDVFKTMHRARQSGAQAMVMEVSSHALRLHRVDEILFNSAVFTNLSQDHLDFHQTLDAYKRAKLHLFSLLHEEGSAIVNQDDPLAQDIRECNLPRIVSYGITGPADYTATIVDDTIEGITLDISWSGQNVSVVSHLIGSFNAYNILAAFTITHVLGIDIPVIEKGIQGMKRIPGRMERIAENVFVDYAHTPDAIKNALVALRHYCRGRLYVVFGCGGDRDKDKRPRMGKIASECADKVVLTSDNPRSEDPLQVIHDIKQGITRDNAIVIENRADAIAEVLSMIEKDDIVLIAGKGHENYQVIGNKRIDFDDAEVIRECLRK